MSDNQNKFYIVPFDGIFSNTISKVIDNKKRDFDWNHDMIFKIEIL